MKIRKRQNRAGSSWQVDLGVIQGKRKQVSFSTREDAEVFMQEARLTVAPRPRRSAHPFRLSSEVADEQRATIDRQTAEIARLNEQCSELQAEIAAARRMMAAVEIPDPIRDVAHLLVRHLVPMQCGVYFLIKGGEVVYVGQARCIMRRLSDHRRGGDIGFDAACWMEVDLRELNRVERQWMHRLKPKMNVRYLPVPA